METIIHPLPHTSQEVLSFFLSFFLPFCDTICVSVEALFTTERCILDKVSEVSGVFVCCFKARVVCGVCVCSMSVFGLGFIFAACCRMLLSRKRRRGLCAWCVGYECAVCC